MRSKIQTSSIAEHIDFVYTISYTRPNSVMITTIMINKHNHNHSSFAAAIFSLYCLLPTNHHTKIKIGNPPTTTQV